MLLVRHSPSLLRALVIVDVGPEVSDRGRAVIAGFVRDNEELTTWSTSYATCSSTIPTVAENTSSAP